MLTNFINIGLGFLEGLGLILSPCILPILPIIFAGSLTGSKKRPFGIIIGFILIFALFTFFSRRLVQHFGFDSNLIRTTSFGILILLGIIMLSTTLTEKFAQLTQRLSNTGSQFSTINNPQGGFISGLLFGGLIAIIWTPCAGPILAAIIVQTVIQKTTYLSFIVLLAFGIGAAVPMLIIILFGRKIMEKLTYFKKHSDQLRKILGAIIILSVACMIYFEGGISQAHALSLENSLSRAYAEPEIAGIDAWINSPPLQLTNLKGKVVLIDFWTYSCINCIRTLPYINDWYDKYHDKGLVIIGVHTPEFDFEKKLDNVKNAVSKYQIKYPVALDNQFATWQNFNNQYWPAHFLIDKKGYVVYTHFGEGEYGATENNIRYLLGMDESIKPPKILVEAPVIDEETPETYLGYARAEAFSSPESVSKDEVASYTFPSLLNKNHWALKGTWKIMRDRIISQEKNAKIEIKFNARKVFVVMGNEGSKPIMVDIFLNGKMNKTIEVKAYFLYEAVELGQMEQGVLEVIASEPGLEVYTFTFGR